MATGALYVFKEKKQREESLGPTPNKLEKESILLSATEDLITFNDMITSNIEATPTNIKDKELISMEVLKEYITAKSDQEKKSIINRIDNAINFRFVSIANQKIGPMREKIKQKRNL